MIKAAEMNRQLGKTNRAKVLKYLVTHPGATRIECAKALGMNAAVIGRHVIAIRAVWGAKAKIVKRKIKRKGKR